jgi:hypothetical protein
MRIRGGVKWKLAGKQKEGEGEGERERERERERGVDKVKYCGLVWFGSVF